MTMNMRQKIKKSLHHINRFLENADDATLKYLKMSDEQRNIMVNCVYNVHQSHDEYSMAIGYSPETNHATIYYNPEIEELDQNSTTKIVIHEMGHVFERLRHDDKLAKLSNSFPLKYLYQYNAHFDAGIDLVSLVAGEFFPGSRYLISMGLSVLGGIGLYPARQMEVKCDDLADKIMPEMTQKQENKNTDALKGIKRTTFTKMMESFSSFFSTHPSTSYRESRSDKMCKKYLKQKQELGIPSIYIPADNAPLPSAS